MSSQVDICNQALSILKAGRISSFDDNTISSNECAAIYDNVSKIVQSKGPWACNKIRTSLPQLSVTPSFGYDYKYQLPTSPKCLRVLAINETTPGAIDYKIENNTLLTNETVASILYVGFLTDSEQFDPFLEESIIDHLVARMAYGFTGDKILMQACIKYAAQNLQDLLTLSSVQGSNDRIPSDAYVNIRFSDSTDYYTPLDDNT